MPGRGTGVLALVVLRCLLCDEVTFGGSGNSLAPTASTPSRIAMAVISLPSKSCTMLARPGPVLDWTFVTNSNTYTTLKQLHVLVQVIPEPSTVLLCGCGLVGLVARRRGSSLVKTRDDAMIAKTSCLTLVIAAALLVSSSHAAIITTPVSNGSSHTAFDANASAADLVRAYFKTFDC